MFHCLERLVCHYEVFIVREVSRETYAHACPVLLHCGVYNPNESNAFPAFPNLESAAFHLEGGTPGGPQWRFGFELKTLLAASA